MAGFIVDTINTSVPVDLLPATVVNANLTSSFIDGRDILGPLSMTAVVGTVTGTLPTAVVQLQEAKEDPTNLGNPLASDWSTVVGGLISLTAASANTSPGKLVTNILKRFLRVTVTLGGTGPIFTMAVTADGQQKIVNPSTGGFSISPQL